MQDFETRLRGTLATYGITDVTVLRHGQSGVAGDDRERVTVLITETDRQDVAEMIAHDILSKAPVFMDISAHGSGRTFRHEGWDRVGGAVFMGYVSSRSKQARLRLLNARAAASNVNAHDPIRADGMLDLAYVAYEAELEKARAEGEDPYWEIFGLSEAV